MDLVAVESRKTTGVLVNAFNLYTWEAETDGTL